MNLLPESLAHDKNLFIPCIYILNKLEQCCYVLTTLPFYLIYCICLSYVPKSFSRRRSEIELHLLELFYERRAHHILNIAFCRIYSYVRIITSRLVQCICEKFLNGIHLFQLIENEQWLIKIRNSIKNVSFIGC